MPSRRGGPRLTRFHCTQPAAVAAEGLSQGPADQGQRVHRRFHATGLSVGAANRIRCSRLRTAGVRRDRPRGDVRRGGCSPPGLCGAYWPRLGGKARFWPTYSCTRDALGKASHPEGGASQRGVFGRDASRSGASGRMRRGCCRQGRPREAGSRRAAA
eukprot:scaffold3_cov108-Isochrysis_galbana.AAC.1